MNKWKLSMLAALLAASTGAVAEQPPKLPLIEHQEQAAEAAVKANQAATPANETRPAVTVKGKSDNSKATLIEQQRKNAAKDIGNTKAATPASEARPAATATSYPHAVESPKANLIREQIKATDQATAAEGAARPGQEARPAATVKQKN